MNRDLSIQENVMVDTVSGAEYVVGLLHSIGVKRVFGVPGGPLLPLLDIFGGDTGPEFILAKHEEGAVFMADGHARGTGELGVVCVTAGPGATHALTGIASAFSDQIPMVLLAGQVSTVLYGRGALQDSSGGDWGIDTAAMFASAAKACYQVTDAAHFPFMLQRALRAAVTGRPGPVVLSLPGNILSSPVTPQVAYTSTEIRGPRASNEEQQALVEALAAARRPLILAGQGAKISTCSSDLVQFAERCGARVATTMKGKSTFPEDHPLALGVFGNYGGSPATHAAVLDPEVDFLLVLGSSMGEGATFGWDPALVQSRQVWQVDLDPLQFGRSMPLHRGIVADSGIFLRDMLALLPELPEPVFPPRMLRQSAEELQAGHQLLRASAVSARLSEIVSPVSTLFVDSGNSLCWIGAHLISKTGMRIFCSLNMASMGYTVPAGIGAKLSSPKVPVISVLGDGAFAMTGMELHTAAETGAAVIWIVLNNSGNAMVANLQEIIHGSSVGAMYTTPIDVAAVARGLGVNASSITDLEGFEHEFIKATASGQPWLLDVRVDATEVPWPLQRRAEVLKGSP